MAERARIARYFAPLTHGESGSFTLTDDAAALTPPPGQQLIVTTDSVIESIHVLPGATPTQFAQKLMRRNLSDLAAMGATPWRYTLNVHMPRDTPDAWFAEFTQALAQEQKIFDMVLIGGDSTTGDADAPIHVTMTCFGLTPSPLRRTGAQVGDDLYVSGTMGDSAMGLQLLQPSAAYLTVDTTSLINHYHLPQPRVALGLKLHGVASSVIDISDGLLADITQLCEVNKVGAWIEREAIPRSSALQSLLATDATLWNLILNGGDDYELCFTAPKDLRETIAALAINLQLPLTRIGEIVEGNGLTLVDADGAPITTNISGWEHA